MFHQSRQAYLKTGKKHPNPRTPGASKVTPVADHVECAACGRYLTGGAGLAEGVRGALGDLGGFRVSGAGFRVVGALDLGVIQRPHDARALEQVPQYVGIPVLGCHSVFTCRAGGEGRQLSSVCVAQI